MSRIKIESLVLNYSFTNLVTSKGEVLDYTNLISKYSKQHIELLNTYNSTLDSRIISGCRSISDLSDKDYLKVIIPTISNLLLENNVIILEDLSIYKYNTSFLDVDYMINHFWNLFYTMLKVRVDKFNIYQHCNRKVILINSFNFRSSVTSDLDLASITMNLYCKNVAKQLIEEYKSKYLQK